MQRVGRVMALLALSCTGCGAGDATVTSTAPSSVADGGGTAGATSGSEPQGTTGNAGPEAMAPVTADAAVADEEDASVPVAPSGDACMDAAMRIATCFLTRKESGAAACKSGAVDAAPTIARFLVSGGSCDTLTKQGITLSTPCDQPPLPQHVTQLVGFEAAAKLCMNGPVNTAAVCNSACENLAPCVDEKMLDEKLKDAARCFDGCIRNSEDATTFGCSAMYSDCTALAEMCWTES